MNFPQTSIQTDVWVDASWDDYIRLLEQPAYEKAKGYYYNGKMRIEMSPVGSDHSRDHGIVILAVSLFAASKKISVTVRDNCTYRKAGREDTQPDVSYYIGEQAEAIPWGTTIVNLDQYPSPDLVIEIANTSFADDIGEKRLLYEDLQVKEYWVVDVQKVQVIAFAIANGGSRRIAESQVLPGLAISLLQEAFQRTRQTNQSDVVNWLLSEFQKP